MAKRIIKYPSFNEIKFKLILFFPIIFFIQLYGQSENSEFKNISIDDGLSQSTVNCIYQDKDGFMWFGTDDGLDKYDGYTFTIFRNDPAYENSLTNSSIDCICPLDSNENILLIGTINGLNEFDIQQGTATRCIQNDNNNIHSQIDVIYCIYRDREQNIWVGTGEGLRLFDTKNRSFILPTRDIPCLKLIDNNKVKSIFEDSFGNLWVGAHNGLLKIQKDRKHYNFYKNKQTNQKGIVNFIFEDSRRCLWFCTEDDGVYKSANQDSSEFYPLKSELKNNQYINDKNIRAFFENNNGSIWLGSTDAGLYCLTYNGSKLIKILNNKLIAKNGSSTYSNKVLSIYEDNSGIIWLGTRAGIFKSKDENKINFKLFKSSSDNNNTLLDNSVWSFFESKYDMNNIWIGTSRGISRLDRQSGNFTNFPEPDFGHKDKSFQVRGICENTSKQLWLATLGGGLIEFDKTNSVYKNLKEKIEKGSNEQEDLGYSVCSDGNNIIWMGTNNGGLIRFNKNLNVYKKINLLPLMENISFFWITSICKDDPDILWLGTWNLGLIRYNYETGKYQQFRHNPTNSNSVSSDIILSIYKSKNNILWIGTYGGGLNKLDLKTGQFSHYFEKDGLSNNVIYGILEDNSGNLWMSTNKGLSKFNPATQTFTNYGVEDGIQGNEFNLGACYKTKDGELFFGGDNGFNSFYPDATINQIPPKIVLTNFIKNGNKLSYTGSLNNVKQIDLTYDENNFSIEFVALHYKDPLKNQYAYQLSGIDKHWIYTNNKRKVSYTGLLPGNYVFKIKAANCDGVWTDNPVELSIIISPPFWQQLWFILATGIMILITVYIYGKNRAYRKLRLEKIKNEEREILRKRIAADFHDELGHRVTKINMMSKLLETELNNKTNEASDYIHKITENADGLFNEMREFIWELNPERDSLNDLATHLKSFSEQIFDQTDVAFQLVGLKDEYEEIKLPMDWRQHLLRIFKEGMHNILKHAKDCKNVCLEITFKEKRLIIILSDDGTGFTYNGNHAGNGLINMCERAKKLNGTLNIESDIGQGSRITFRGKLP